MSLLIDDRVSDEMNEFMNALYNAVGSDISGYRNDGVAFLGKIIRRRAKAGNDISLTVFDPDLNEEFIILASDVFAGVRNLHVYF